jgi:subtilase family serine protease
MARTPKALATVAIALLTLLVALPTSALSARPSGDGSGASPSYGPALPPGTWVPLTVALAPAHASSLALLLRQVEDPASSEYRHYLTERQFEAEYRPSPGAVAAVEAFLERNGARGIVRSSDGLGLSFAMPAGRLPGAWGLSLHTVARMDGGTVFAPDGVPRWPAALAPFVLGVGGLDDQGTLVARASLLASLGHGRPAEGRVSADAFVIDHNLSAQLYVGSDLDGAYGVTPLFPGGSFPNASFATHEAVATLLFSSYNSTSAVDLPPFDPGVLDQYFNATFPPAWPRPNVSGVPITVNGVTPPAPGTFGTLQDDSLSEAENSLDLEMAGSSAPGAEVVNFYVPQSQFLAVGPGGVPYSSLADTMAGALGSALNFTYGGARLAAVSNSYGLADLVDPLWDSELQHAAAIGVTVLAASGDQGDAPNGQTGRQTGAAPVWPATVAYNASGVLAVGGTMLTLSGVPTTTFDPPAELNLTYDSNITGIASEAAWYTTAGGTTAGTEGGVSGTYPEPAWQFGSAAQPGIVNATVLAQQGALGRAVPDVGLAASNIIDLVAENASGTYFSVVGGTSASSPYLAGILAECAAVVGHPFGYLDPLLYRMGSYYAANPANTTDPFRAILNGSNYLFSATPGWDALTGWGSLDVARLPAALVSPSIAGYVYTGPTPGLPPGTPSHPGPVPSAKLTPLLIAIIAALAIGLVLAILIAVRREEHVSPPPPPGAYGYAPSVGYPPPPVYRPVCFRCGRERPWGSTVCPYCGAF